jgi:hypothetical protein
MDNKTLNEMVRAGRWRQPANRQKESRLGRSGSEIGTEDEILKALDAAVSVSRSGNRLQARQLCAAIIFEFQHFIASRTVLLRATLCALLVAHAFRLLSRFVLPSCGFSVRVSSLPDGTEQPRIHLGPDGVRLVVNQRLLDDLSPDHRFLRELCNALGHDTSHSGLPAELEDALYLHYGTSAHRNTGTG